MPEELWEHEAAMVIKSNIIKVVTEEIEGLSAQLKGAVPGAAAAVAVLMNRAIVALSNIIDDLCSRRVHHSNIAEHQEQALKMAGDALAKAFGPVNGLFGQGVMEKGRRKDMMTPFYLLLPLRADVNALSTEVMKALLGSEMLQMRSENDSYYLLCAWLSQTPHISDEDERQALFELLLPLLRFHHMSHDFLCSVVSACPFASTYGLLRYIMCRSHLLRTAPRSLAQEEGVSKNRSVSNLNCIYKSTFDLVDPLSLTKSLSDDESISLYKYLGLELGFPVGVKVEREAEDTAGAYVLVGMPSCEELNVDGSGVYRRAGFEYLLNLGGEDGQDKGLFDEDRICGWEDFFGKSWTEVVCPGSPHFPNDMLAVELSMKRITKEDGIDDDDDEDDEDDESDDDEGGY